jgi:hypothetical protein
MPYLVMHELFYPFKVPLVVLEAPACAVLLVAAAVLVVLAALADAYYLPYNPRVL